MTPGAAHNDFGTRRPSRTSIRVCTGLFLCCASTFALDPSLDVSQYAHASWKLSETFGKGTIWAVGQTPDGYLWLGTEFGLRRFDGIRTVEWQPPAGERLPSTEIRNLMTSRDGTLWIGTGGGLASWKSGKLTNYPDFDRADISALLEDHEGVVWAAGKIWQAGTATPSKLCAISATHAVHCFASGRFGPHVTAIFEDSRANLWLGTGTGIWHFKPGTPVYYPSPDFPGNNILFPKGAFLEDNEGGLLISGPQGIRRLKDGKFSPFRLPPGAPEINYGKLLRDRDGGLWIGTWDSGLLHIHQGRVDVLAQPDGLINESIENLFEDREGNIWAAGVSGLDEFREYAVNTISIKQGLSSASVLSLLGARDGSVWIATSNGLDRWKNGLVTIYRKQAGTAKPQKSTAHAGGRARELYLSGAPDNFGLRSLYQAPNGVLWVTHKDGYFRFEHDKFSLLRVQDIEESWQSPVTRDSAGNVWVAEAHGLYRLSGDKVAEHFPSTALGLTGNIAGLLVPDPLQGGLWVASWQGGIVYFENGNVRASYGPNNGLPAASIHALQLGSQNTLWAATDLGVSRIGNGRVGTLNSGNGLPCDNAHAVTLDGNRSLWIYMDCGLVRVTSPELDSWIADANHRVQATLFDISDGVKTQAGIRETGPRMTMSSDGNIWFTSLYGVSVVDPHRLHVNGLPPQVAIEQITANGKRYRIAHAMRLPPRVRQLALEFTALSYVAPEKVRLRFRLDPQDPDWREVSSDRKAEYSNLDPGHYRFRVIACNNSGVWNTTGAALDFSVDPAYYQTNWFVAGCVAVALLAGWMLYRFRLHQMAREFNAHLEGRVEERLQVARELHDTLLQSFQALLIHLQAARNLLASDYDAGLTQFDNALEIGDEALVEGRDAIQGMRSSTEISNDLARAFRAVGDEMTSGSSAEFRVRVNGSSRDLHPILRHEVYAITREAIRNAVHHADAKAIEVDLHYDNSLRVRVRDDGKGIDPAVLKQGRSGHYGLAGMRERAARMGGELKVSTAPGAGTEVELTIPGSLAYSAFGFPILLRLFRHKVKGQPARGA